MNYQGHRSNEPYREYSQRYQEPQSNYSNSYQSQQGNYRNEHENYSKRYQSQHENNFYKNQQSLSNLFDSYQSQKQDFPCEFTSQARYNHNSGDSSVYTERYHRRSDTDFASTSFKDRDNLSRNSFSEKNRQYRDRYKPYDKDSRGISEPRNNYNKQVVQSREHEKAFKGNQQFTCQSALQEVESKGKSGPEDRDYDDFEDHIYEDVVEDNVGLYEDTNFGEEGCDYYGNQESCEKINPYTPEPSIVAQHSVFPPSTEELREMLSDLVIYFFYKIKKNVSVPEKNHFVVICESFRRSGRYSELNIEDGYHSTDKFRKYATLKWHGMIMARGASEYANLKEPRVRASVELINKLAQFCYTLKAKDTYFSNEGFQRLLVTKEIPGAFKVVPQNLVRNTLEVAKYMDSFFANDTDCELIFNDPSIIKPVLSYARKKGYSTRNPRPGFIAACKTRTPQYWRDKILSSGQMENEKFCLIPPQGLGKDLLEDFDILETVPSLNKHALPPPQLKKQPHKKALRTTTTPVPQLYGPKGVGPHIILAKPPWERQSFNRKGKKSFNKKNKFKKKKKFNKKQKS